MERQSDRFRLSEVNRTLQRIDECLWIKRESIVTVKDLLVSRLKEKEIGSDVRFPNYHNRQPKKKKPRSVLFTSRVNSFIRCPTVKLTVSLQNYNCLNQWHSFFYAKKFAYVSNIVSPETRQISNKSHLREQLCFFFSGQHPTRKTRSHSFQTLSFLSLHQCTWWGSKVD